MNAHRVNRGEPPDLESPPGGEPGRSDFYFVERDDPVAARDTLVELVCERIPSRFGLDPRRDIQVLTPMRKGQLGVVALNRELQAVLNARNRKETAGLNGEEIEEDGMLRLRVGDRIMQTANDYEKDVSNGDIGRVVSINEESGEVIVQFEGRAVGYLPDELSHVTLAYAVTIHKSQGSEYPAVIVPVASQHASMLRRKLLYTSVTRASRLVVLVGSRAALAQAVAQEEEPRLSRLRNWLGA